MATAVFAKMLDNYQHLTLLIPESWNCTLNSSRENIRTRINTVLDTFRLSWVKLYKNTLNVLENLGIDGRIILIWILQKYVLGVLFGFICIGTSCRLLWMQ
jgi:hypothetical protein